MYKVKFYNLVRILISTLLLRNKFLVSSSIFFGTSLFLSVGAFAQSPQFKLTSSTLLVTPQAGGIEYNGTNFFTTNNTLSRTQIIATAAAGTSGTVLISQGAGVPPVWGTVSGGSGSGFSSTVFLTTGTSWTVPAGVTKIRVTIQAGGGGSGGTSDSGCGGSAGGGGGGYSIKTYSSLTPGTSATISIGGGGAGGLATGASGSAGGSTSFTYSGVTISATGGGGGGGQTCSANVAGGSGGTGSGGDFNGRGMPGHHNTANNQGAVGGAGYFLGGGNGIVDAQGQTGLNGGGGAGTSLSVSSAGSAGGAGLIMIEY